MSQRDNQVYIEQMIETANKALNFVEGISREDFDNNELLQLSLTHTPIFSKFLIITD